MEHQKMLPQRFVQMVALQRQLEAFKSRLAPILAGRQNFNQGGSGGAKSKMSSNSR